MRDLDGAKLAQNLLENYVYVSLRPFASDNTPQKASVHVAVSPMQPSIWNTGIPDNHVGAPGGVLAVIPLWFGNMEAVRHGGILKFRLGAVCHGV